MVGNGGLQGIPKKDGEKKSRPRGNRDKTNAEKGTAYEKGAQKSASHV